MTDQTVVTVNDSMVMTAPYSKKINEILNTGKWQGSSSTVAGIRLDLLWACKGQPNLGVKLLKCLKMTIKAQG